MFATGIQQAQETITNMKKILLTITVSVTALSAGVGMSGQTKTWTLQDCIDYAIENNISLIKRKTIDIGEIDEYGNVRIDTDLLNQPLGGIERRNIPLPTRRRRHYEDDDEIQTFPEEERPEIIQRKLIQSALAIFLGSLGAHKFYQGKTWQGVLYLLFFWTTLPTWIGFAEGIRYLFMPVEDFYEQYMKKEKDKRNGRNRRRD